MRSTCARPQAATEIRCIVIGYGNDLRGDDAAGRRVADAVEDWGLPGVDSLSVHQLTPELADLLARAGQAIFVDAYPAAAGQALQIVRLEPHTAYVPSPGVGHFGDPRALLELTAQLHGYAPPARLVAVPAANFDFTEELSAVAETGIAEALEQIRGLIEEEISCTKSA